MLISPLSVVKALNHERLAGTQGELVAAHTIVNLMQEINLSARIEEFDLATSPNGSAKISFDGKVISAIPYGLVKSSEISGKLVFVEDSRQLKVDEGKYVGKIVVSSNSCRDLNQILIDGGIKAFILISQPMKKAFCLYHHQTTFEDHATPIVSISYEDGIKLINYQGENISISVNQEVLKSHGHNVVVDIKGTNPDNNLTYLVGHLDSVQNTSGASDNAGGCACIAHIASFFAKNPPKRDLRIIFCGGEEMGLLGSSAYVEDNLEEVKKRGKLVVNIDVAGDIIGQDALCILGTNQLLGYADGIARENGIFTQKSLDIYSSDCMPFANYEIPAINIARWGGLPSFTCHTADDTPKYITERSLMISATLGLKILERILNANIYPVDKEIDASLKEKVEKYMYWSRRKEPNLDWLPNYKK